ncbi:hypothetical protein [Mesorhizobium sangaii]|uniref:Uncharacterized protein n=1 Tax=Mesorhizobium sangaii TaxID=505389 RepID=A0A841PJV2_9HYPH|nr:hypothetical protein [Mesorhizobium sangaii]MBB6411000.1 hypothetical protein [Mesorhizobium sangaii]
MSLISPSLKNLCPASASSSGFQLYGSHTQANATFAGVAKPKSSLPFLQREMREFRNQSHQTGVHPGLLVRKLPPLQRKTEKNRATSAN